MIHRVEVQTDIIYCKLNIDGVYLPHKRKEKTTIYALPSDEEIENTIAKAKNDAYEIAGKFGMTSMQPASKAEVNHFEFKSNLMFDEIDELDEEFDEEFYEADHENIDHYVHIDESIDESCVDHDLDLDFGDDKHDTKSTLVEITDEDDTNKVIPKSTFLWMLIEPGVRPSNDRLRRFKK